MKIAILGTRGIPAAYSGFETAVEHLAAGFAGRGHEVVVYCRPHVVDRELHEHVGASFEVVERRAIRALTARSLGQPVTSFEALWS